MFLLRTLCCKGYITYIFNKVLLTGTFPDRLKFSEVKPLYEKGDKFEFTNYRPISLLPTFSKIIEKIIFKRLYAHINKHNILVSEKFGFKEKSSTEIATHILLNNILCRDAPLKTHTSNYYFVYLQT
jgi:hypothetical protein